MTSAETKQPYPSEAEISAVEELGMRVFGMTLRRGATFRPMMDGWLAQNPDGQITYVSLWQMIRWQWKVARRARKENPDE